MARNDEVILKKGIAGHSMYLFKNDRGICSTLARGGWKTREAAFMRIIRDEVEPGMNIADFGSNVGFVTLVMAQLAKSGKIYTIEPDPRNYDLAIKNLDLNGYGDRVVGWNGAISNFDGKVMFNTSDASNLGSIGKTRNTTGKAIKVRAMKADTVFADYPVEELPNFYKMDIEGHEVEALEGMYETLKRSTKTTKAIIEVHPQFFDGSKFEAILRKLVSVGYNIKYVVSAGHVHPKLFKERGYNPNPKYKFHKGFYRSVFTDISNDDAIYFCSYPHKQPHAHNNQISPKIVRSILLEKVGDQ